MQPILSYPTHILKNVSRFQLCAHTLAMESSLRRDRNEQCDNLKCSYAVLVPLGASS